MRRRQPRPAWPGGARCAVVLTFDLDAELYWLRLHESAADRPKTLSLGTYGVTRGVPRLLGLLGERGLPGTWFVPEHTARAHPAAVRAVAAAGHEVAVAAPPGVPEVWTRTADLLTGLTGTRPRGLRAAPARLPDDHGARLRDAGFTYSSSTHGDDLPHTLWTAGRPTGVVELPWAWEHAEAPHFVYNGGPVRFPPGGARIAPYEQVLADWKDAFDAYRDLGLCLVLALDPQSAGKPGRALLVEELLDHMLAPGDVWFATGAQAAAQCRPAEEPEGHPERVRATWATTP